VSALPCVNGYDRPDIRRRCECDDCADARILNQRRQFRRAQPATTSRPRSYSAKGTPHPFALKDLEAALGVSLNERGVPDKVQTANLLDVSTRTVDRLRAAGLTEWQADEYAVRGRLHPGAVWETWWSETG